MGQSIHICHFLFFEESMYSPVGIRLPLQGYEFRKGLRKLRRKVHDRFQVVVRPGAIDKEKNALFENFRYEFKGKIPWTLKLSLLENGDTNIFDTWEVAVYDKKKLIAFSFFDLGETSLASIKGVYDSKYSAYSLGFFTMLEEIDFGIRRGLRYFYPGYVVPGHQRFDYKLRIGTPEQLEFLETKQKAWLPYTDFQEHLLPVKVLTNKLLRIAQELFREKVNCQLLFYPAFEMVSSGNSNNQFLESPLFLHLFSNVFSSPRFIIYYDLWKETYIFTHCMPEEDLGFYFEYSMQFDTQEARHYLDFILEKTRIAESPDPAEIIRFATHIGRYVRPAGWRGFMK
jgi:arginine-tRNA-protein transferase